MTAAMVVRQDRGDMWAAYCGDSSEVLAGIPDESLHLSIFSPPFSSLYTYSNSERDLGNCKDDEQFFRHFEFIARELFRATMSGRLVAFHCMNLTSSKERDGYIGLRDFRGDLIRMFDRIGFIYHSEHAIWKDPLLAAVRTKALGLMHKQLCKDSAMCRAGLPEYFIAMRKPGQNPEPVAHPHGLREFVGDFPPTSTSTWSRLSELFGVSDEERDGPLEHKIWRRYASPIWLDVRPNDTLNAAAGRDSEDERHICPLSLDAIERALTLWSNPGDIVLSPFMGIGSEGFMAIKMARRFVGIELKPSYYEQAVKNLRRAESEIGSQLPLLAGEQTS